MSTLKVDLDLVQKYNVAGPRYTSYPPATKFSDKLGWEELSGHIEANNRNPHDLSIYFHIPFCETLCWFCGCTTVITPPARPSSSTSAAAHPPSCARMRSAGSARSSINISPLTQTSKPA